MATCISRCPEDTAALGECWGREARPGWVLGLTGELGAGKTQLVKGLARGLGFPGRVHSPTFVLVNTYAGGRLPLVHLDLYRIETAEQIAAAGLEEFLRDDSGVAVIEWAERWFGSAASREPNPFTPSLSPSDGERVAKPGEGVGGFTAPGRDLPKAVGPSAQPNPLEVPTRWRRVQIEILSETERRIIYEDLGA